MQFEYVKKNVKFSLDVNNKSKRANRKKRKTNNNNSPSLASSKPEIVIKFKFKCLQTSTKGLVYEIYSFRSFITIIIRQK